MIVRYYKDSDFERVREMHKAQGFEYDLPDMQPENFYARIVLENNREVQAALLLRKPTEMAEVFLIMEPSKQAQGLLANKEILGKLLLLNKEATKIAKRVGLRDVWCMLPPSLERKFGSVLLHKVFGWARHPWTMFYKEVN